MIRRLASLPWLRWGTVRQFRRYYQGAMTSCRSSRRTSLPSLGGTSAFTRSFRSPADECAAEAWSCYPGISGREFAEETTGPRKFLGNPNYPFAHVQSTPAGLRPPDHCGVAAWPPVSEQQRLPREVFRRSIAWLSDWLSTLRGAGHPRPTQDSLPAAGQALPDGLSTRRVPLKGFRAVSYISSPFPKLLAAIGSTDARKTRAQCFGVSDRRAQDRSDGKPDDTVQNTVGRLCGRAASRAKNGDEVRAADIVPMH
jgi:hypothetical protein